MEPRAYAHTLLQGLGLFFFFLVKDQTVNIFYFAGHMVSVTTIRLARVVGEQPRTMHKGRSEAGLQ